MTKALTLPGVSNDEDEEEEPEHTTRIHHHYDNDEELAVEVEEGRHRCEALELPHELLESLLQYAVATGGRNATEGGAPPVVADGYLWGKAENEAEEVETLLSEIVERIAADATTENVVPEVMREVISASISRALREKQSAVVGEELVEMLLSRASRLCNPLLLVI